MSIVNPSRRKILVVDDEPAICNGVKDTLELEEYEVITANDGQEGLKLALSIDPDLVLLGRARADDATLRKGYMDFFTRSLGVHGATFQG